MLAQGRVIAKRAAEGVKRSSPFFEIAGQRFEYHWYEHPGIGKVELKRKQVEQR